MNVDAANLDNLRDIVTPPPVPWWPPAPGWWFLLAMLTVALVIALFRGLRKWRANAYRRAALRAIQAASNLAEVAELLKRAALAAYPRNEVAPLSGVAWTDWLGKTTGRQVPGNVVQALTRDVFARPDTPVDPGIRDFAADWIRRHRVCGEDGGSS